MRGILAVFVDDADFVETVDEPGEDGCDEAGQHLVLHQQSILIHPATTLHGLPNALFPSLPIFFANYEHLTDSLARKPIVGSRGGSRIFSRGVFLPSLLISYKDLIFLTKFFSPQANFSRNRPKKPFLGTFWKILTRKNREGAFKKISRSVSQKQYLKTVQWGTLWVGKGSNPRREVSAKSKLQNCEIDYKNDIDVEKERRLPVPG